jgi:hypothetical protein
MHLSSQLNFWAPRDVKTYVYYGRAICRLVVLFDSVESLVQESDRRLALEEGDELDDAQHTEEYAFAEPSYHSCAIMMFHSEERTFRAYKHLIQHIPIIKKKLDNLEPEGLQELYKGVSTCVATVS